MSEIRFDNNEQRETLRSAFDVHGLPLDTTKSTQGHVIVGRDNDRQDYIALRDKKIAQLFDSLGDGRSVRYVHVSALPPSAQPAKHDKM